MALSGNRLNVIFNNRTLNPLEHVVEPDNKIGFDDIPTAPMQRIYDIEGPLGMLFGGHNAVSSLIMMPHDPETTRAESRLVVDKGSYGYANTEALFMERSKTGRSIKAALEYRLTDGIYTGFDDDAYHQWGELVLPVKPDISLELSGRLYRRTGKLPMRPYISSVVFNQHRRDRDLTAAVNYLHPQGGKSKIEFRHQRSESSLNAGTNPYRRNFDIFDNSLSLIHERQLGEYAVSSRLNLTQEQYNESSVENKRKRALLSLNALRHVRSGAVAANFRIEKVGGYNPAPSAAVAYSINRERFYLLGSLGYCTGFPRQYELDLSPYLGRFVDVNLNDYFESGNPDLEPEKQLVANATFGLGIPGNDFVISLTAGKIYDAIDWRHFKKDTLSLSVDAFQTANRDIEFAGITLMRKFTWRDFLYWKGGGSYRYNCIAGDDSPPYFPEYQLFSNLELHQYIRKLDLHLYGYIEGSYIAPFDSYAAFNYNAGELGDVFIVNAKLSFRIKSFRFYYYFQNLLDLDIELRDDYIIQGRIHYYGFTWDFLD